MSTYLIIHMNDINPWHKVELFTQTLHYTLKDSEIIGTVVKGSMPADILEARLKEIVQDRADVIPMLVYSDDGYELGTNPTDLVYVSALATDLTGNRAKDIAYTYSDIGKRGRTNPHFTLDFE